MKYIIIGLGNFGSSLAEKLTNMGHEVIGVDHEMHKVEAVKEKVSYAICLDSTDSMAVESLPLQNTDVVIVCIGRDVGANIMTTALMKKTKVPRLLSRSNSALHETVLEAMGIDEILRPEEESAERWVKRLTTSRLVDSFELSKGFSVIEAIVPLKFVGKTVEELDVMKVFNVLVLTIIKQTKERNLIGIPRKVAKVQGIVTAKTVFSEGDIMVLYGKDDDIQNLLKE
ncbi:MAG: TrkA family potassium uptake protein [Bacteroidetes bacterium]|nr:TrkA family potassium uptake protein [Bacteroidota bacterium]MBU1719166.1 TrkA family potassium uptake protein [Bacteroidota bacterium]